MSKEAMKNLSKLLKWSKEVELKGPDGTTIGKVWIRLVGDLTYQTAQQYALVASRNMRKKLHDKTSLEYQAMFLDINDRSDSDLVMGIVLAEMANYRDWAIEEVDKDIKTIPELNHNAKLEEQEEHQKA